MKGIFFFLKAFKELSGILSNIFLNLFALSIDIVLPDKSAYDFANLLIWSVVNSFNSISFLTAALYSFCSTTSASGETNSSLIKAEI